MDMAASAIQYRFLTAIDRSHGYSERAIAALKVARALMSWMLAVSILASVATFATSRWAFLFIVLAALSFPARLKLGDVLQNLIWARNQVRDLPDPDHYKSGVLLSVRAHPSPLTGLEEPMLAEILEDDGGTGTAKVVSDPLGGMAVVPHGSGPFVVRKGDVIRYHRKQESYPGIFAKLATP